MNPEITLHDYRLLYPRTAPIPTLTQSGLIGGLLQREERRALRRAQRRASLRRLLTTPGRAVAWLSSVWATPPHRAPQEVLVVASTRRA